MLDAAQRIAFRLEDLVAAFRVHAAFLDHLDRERLARLPVCTFLHLREVARSNGVLDDVVPAHHTGRGTGSATPPAGAAPRLQG